MVICMPSQLGRRWLRGHLDRLAGALESLRDRVRDAIAQVVSEAVGKAVREVVRVLVGPGEEVPSEPSWSPDRSRYEGESWDHPRQPAWSNPASEWGDEDPYDERDEDDVPITEPVSEPTSRRKRFTQALVLGLQTAAWWLRRRTAGLSPRVTLVVGAVASLAAYLVGPVAAISGAGVFGAAFGLLNFADSFATVLSH